jgi:phosphatidylinositol glycan class C protein
MIIQASMTVSLSLSAVTLTASLSRTIANIICVILVSVVFVAPALLMWAQKYKKCVLQLTCQVCIYADYLT